MKNRNEVKHPIAQNLDAAIARVLELDKQFDTLGYVRDGLEWDCAMIDLAKFAKLRKLEQKARKGMDDITWQIECEARKELRENPSFKTLKAARASIAESRAESLMENYVDAE